VVFDLFVFVLLLGGLCPKLPVFLDWQCFDYLHTKITFTLFVFVCIYWCPTQIVLCFLFCLSSSCEFYVVRFSSGLSIFSLPLRCSLTFIYKWQELLTLLENLGSLRFLLRICVAHLRRFMCCFCVLIFFVLCLVCNVAGISGLSILYISLLEVFFLFKN
jgi:hypothetical protein